MPRKIGGVRHLNDLLVSGFAENGGRYRLLQRCLKRRHKRGDWRLQYTFAETEGTVAARKHLVGART